MKSQGIAQSVEARSTMIVKTMGVGNGVLLLQHMSEISARNSKDQKIGFMVITSLDGPFYPRHS